MKSCKYTMHACTTHDYSPVTHANDSDFRVTYQALALLSQVYITLKHQLWALMLPPQPRGEQLAVTPHFTCLGHISAVELSSYVILLSKNRYPFTDMEVSVNKRLSLARDMKSAW